MFKKVVKGIKFWFALIVAIVVLVAVAPLFKSGSYDPTWIFICAAVSAVAFLVYVIFDRLMPAIVIETNISLKEPFLPIWSRCKFTVTVTAREQKKGSSVVIQNQVEVKLREKDHPNFVAECLHIIDMKINETTEQIRALYPKARIQISDSYVKSVKALLPEAIQSSASTPEGTCE
jgi:hypothetical protein